MLTVERLEVGYGKATVVWDVSVRVEAGEIVTIIGANGAGKTTILRAVAGGLPPPGGRIALRGRGSGGGRRAPPRGARRGAPGRGGRAGPPPDGLREPEPPRG